MYWIAPQERNQQQNFDVEVVKSRRGFSAAEEEFDEDEDGELVGSQNVSGKINLTVKHV